MAARILILTGASSTGKTAVARAVQLLAPAPAVVLAADACDLPVAARARAALRAAPPAEVAALQRAMFRAFYEGLARWPAHGIGAIAETIFLDEDQLRICRGTLAAASYAIVRLVCAPGVRAERERRRRDRRTGWARETALAAVIPDGLALELDTTHCSPEEAATRLLPFL